MSEKSDYQKHLESMSEIEYKRLTQGNWSKEHDTRVRCTADGDYPRNLEQVEFEHSIFSHHIGTFFLQRGDSKNVFYDPKSDTSYFHADNYYIYWKPLTSLKEQYERERE